MGKNLSTELGGMKLANPTMLAAGILGITGSSLRRAVEAGAGAVVTKSVGPTPRDGYPNPTVVQVECGLLNAMGLPNPGVKLFGEEIKDVKGIVPVIVSIYGSTSEEYVRVAKIAVEGGADALELNLSCPHVKETGAEIGSDPKMVEKVVKAVKENVKQPVIVKLTPNVTDVTAIAKAAEASGADAITAINTLKAMAIEVETMRPLLANRIGGLSGPAIKPVALRCIYEIYRAVDVPVIGCGGITTWRDAVEFILAGASAVQIGTAIAFRGVEVFKAIADGVDRYIQQKRFKSITDIIGLAHV